MKHEIASVGFALLAATSYAQEIEWRTDYDSALKEAGRAGKNVLIHFSSEG